MSKDKHIRCWCGFRASSTNGEWLIEAMESHSRLAHERWATIEDLLDQVVPTDMEFSPVLVDLTAHRDMKPRSLRLGGRPAMAS